MEEDKLAILHITHKWNMRWLEWERQGANEADHWLVPTLCLLVPVKLNYSPLSFLCCCSRFLLSLITLVYRVFKVRRQTLSYLRWCFCIFISWKKERNSLGPRAAAGRSDSTCVCQEVDSDLMFSEDGHKVSPLPRYEINTLKPCRQGLVGFFFAPVMSG